jgi:hypothetical protein
MSRVTSAAILAAVGPEPRTARDVATELHASQEATRRTLAEAARTGRLYHVGGGAGGRDAYYATVPDAPISGTRLSQPRRSNGARSYPVNRSPALNAALAAQLRAETDAIGHERRPATRGDCSAARGGLPCPWVSCSHHLAIVVTGSGTLQVLAPTSPDDPMELDLEAMAATCVLDVIDEHENGIGQEQAALALNLTRERVRQLEVSGLARLEVMAARLGLEPDKSVAPKRRRLPIVADCDDGGERGQGDLFSHLG